MYRLLLCFVPLCLTACLQEVDAGTTNSPIDAHTAQDTPVEPPPPADWPALEHAVLVGFDPTDTRLTLLTDVDLVEQGLDALRTGTLWLAGPDAETRWLADHATMSRHYAQSFSPRPHRDGVVFETVAPGDVAAPLSDYLGGHRGTELQALRWDGSAVSATPGTPALFALRDRFGRWFWRGAGEDYRQLVAWDPATGETAVVSPDTVGHVVANGRVVVLEPGKRLLVAEDDALRLRLVGEDFLDDAQSSVLSLAQPLVSEDGTEVAYVTDRHTLVSHTATKVSESPEIVLAPGERVAMTPLADGSVLVLSNRTAYAWQPIRTLLSVIANDVGGAAALSGEVVLTVSNEDPTGTYSVAAWDGDSYVERLDLGPTAGMLTGQSLDEAAWWLVTGENETRLFAYGDGAGVDLGEVAPTSWGGAHGVRGGLLYVVDQTVMWWPLGAQSATVVTEDLVGNISVNDAQTHAAFLTPHALHLWQADAHQTVEVVRDDATPIALGTSRAAWIDRADGKTWQIHYATLP